MQPVRHRVGDRDHTDASAKPLRGTLAALLLVLLAPLSGPRPGHHHGPGFGHRRRHHRNPRAAHPVLRRRRPGVTPTLPGRAWGPLPVRAAGRPGALRLHRPGDREVCRTGPRQVAPDRGRLLGQGRNSSLARAMGLVQGRRRGRVWQTNLPLRGPRIVIVQERPVSLERRMEPFFGWSPFLKTDLKVGKSIARVSLIILNAVKCEVFCTNRP